MKHLTILALLITTTAFADILKPGYYTSKEGIESSILGGSWATNLVDPSCPSKMLDNRFVKVAMATGGPIVAVNVTLKADSNKNYLIIHPEFERSSTFVSGTECALK